MSSGIEGLDISSVVGELVGAKANTPEGVSKKLRKNSTLSFWEVTRESAGFSRCHEALFSQTPRDGPPAQIPPDALPRLPSPPSL